MRTDKPSLWVPEIDGISWCVLACILAAFSRSSAFELHDVTCWHLADLHSTFVAETFASVDIKLNDNTAKAITS